MRILFLIVATMLVAGPAQANLCSSEWLKTASASAVRALVRAGADVNEVCNSVYGNRPLHQALLTEEIAPEVVGALIDAGANVAERNNYGQTPFEYVEERFERASRMFRPGTAAYRREASIRDRFHATANAADNAVMDARDKLCDLNWWISSASESAVKALLAVPRVGPNHVCNAINDRPIQIPLRLTALNSPAILPENVSWGIRALVDGGADLTVRNNSGESALDLAELRYDRLSARLSQHTRRWCAGEINQHQLADEITRNEPDIGAYIVIASTARGQSFESMRDWVFMDLYRLNPGESVLSVPVVCSYRGVPDYRDYR